MGRESVPAPLLGCGVTMYGDPMDAPNSSVADTMERPSSLSWSPLLWASTGREGGGCGRGEEERSAASVRVGGEYPEIRNAESCPRVFVRSRLPWRSLFWAEEKGVVEVEVEFGFGICENLELLSDNEL